jgi:hypothetical protein
MDLRDIARAGRRQPRRRELPLGRNVERPGERTLDRLQALTGKPVLDSHYFDAPNRRGRRSTAWMPARLASNADIGGDAGMLQLVLGEGCGRVRPSTSMCTTTQAATSSRSEREARDELRTASAAATLGCADDFDALARLRCCSARAGRMRRGARTASRPTALPSSPIAAARTSGRSSARSRHP